MGRKSPLGIEGTGLSFRDPDGDGRMQTAQVRARDEVGDWQVKRFKVTNWKRDDTPLVPNEATDWARATRRSFVREEAVAKPGTFQYYADLLATDMKASGIKEERRNLVMSISRALAEKEITDLRAENFDVKVKDWISGLSNCWSMAKDAPNRRKVSKPLSAPTRNKILITCRQVTRLAVSKRKIPFDPLSGLKLFKGNKVIRPVFTTDEVRQMVGDASRDNQLNLIRSLRAEIEELGPPKGAAIDVVAKRRKIHRTSIYNALKRTEGPDPWWLACCLLVYTGARADEAMHLRWEWIDWKANVITLRLADDYESKTDSERMIPLEPELKEILLPIAKPAGHILPPEIRSGGSGEKKRANNEEAKGAKDFTFALRRYMARIGMDAKDRTAHSLRHTYIAIKLARADMNVERLRKAVGHAEFSTTMGYGRFSQLFESEVDKWPDSTLWLRRASPIKQNYVKE